MITWAFIFEAPKTDPSIDRMVIERAGLRSIIVAVPTPEAAVSVACDLVSDGVAFLELCGGFEPGAVGKIAEATRGRVPIGTVGYMGGASIATLARVFAETPEA